MITWVTLTDGLLSAVVSGVVVFFAAVYTLVRTRAGDLRREQTRLDERDTEQRQRYVAEVIATLRDLEHEIRLPPFRRAHSAAAFLQACMLFYMTQKAVHEPVATWLMKRNDDYGQMSESWHHVALTPVLGVRRAKELTEFLGAVCGVLVLWATGDLRDEDFSDETLPPSQVATVAAAKRKSAAA